MANTQSGEEIFNGLVSDILGENKKPSDSEKQFQEFLSSEVFPTIENTAQRIANAPIMQERQDLIKISQVGKDTTFFENAIRDVSEFSEGLTSLVGGAVAGVTVNLDDNAKFWFNVIKGTGPSPGEILDFVSDIGGSALNLSLQEISALNPQFTGGKIGTIEAIRRRPINQAMNIATILSLGGLGLVKGLQISGQAGKAVQIGIRAGEAAIETSKIVDPIVLGVKGVGKLSKKIPILNNAFESFSRGVQNARLQGRIKAETLSEFKKDTKILDSAFEGLSQNEAKSVELRVRGLQSAPLSGVKNFDQMNKAYSETLKFLDKYSDVGGFKRVGNTALMADKIFTSQIKSLSSDITKLEGLIGEKKIILSADKLADAAFNNRNSPNIILNTDDAINWAIASKDISQDIASNAAFRDLIDKKIDIRRLAVDKKNLLESSIDEQRSFQDLAIATGIRTRDDFKDFGGMKSFLTKDELSELKKIADAHYFPDVVDPSKLKRGPIKKIVQGTKTFFSKPGAFKKRTGKGIEAGKLLDTKRALNLHGLKMAEYKAGIDFTERFLKDIGDKVKPYTLGDDLLPDHKIVDLEGFRFVDGIQLDIEKRMLDDIAAGKSFEKALENASEFSQKSVETASEIPMKRFQIPEKDAKILQQLFPKRNNFSYIYDNVTDIFRASTLGLSGRWHVNGVVGNMILNTVAGVGPLAYGRLFPKFMDEAMQAFDDVGVNFKWFDPRKAGLKFGQTVFKTGAEGLKRLAQRIDADGNFFIWEDDLLPPALQNGLIEAERYSADVMAFSSKRIGDEFISKNKGFVDASFDLARVTDTFFRQAHYVDKATKLQRRKLMENAGKSFLETLGDIRFGPAKGDLELWKQLTPKDAESIVQNVEKFLFDYRAMHPFEKSFMRRVFPFWSWFRNINKFFFYDLPQMPVRRQVIKFLSDIGEEASMTDDIPEWMRGAIRVGVDDAGNALYIYARGMNPFADTDRTLEGLFNADLLTAPGLHPAIKIGVERLTGLNAFTRRPFQAPDQIRPGVRMVRQSDGSLKKEKILPGFLTHVARQLPQFPLLEEFLAPAVKFDTSTLINPQIKLANDDVLKWSARIKKLQALPRPKTRSAMKKRDAELANAFTERDKALLKRQQSMVTVFSLSGLEEIESKFPKERLRELNKLLLGVNIIPVDTKLQREINQRNERDFVRGQFNLSLQENPDIVIDNKPIKFKDFVRSTKLRAAEIEGERKKQRKRRKGKR